MLLILGGQGYVAQAVARACAKAGMAHRIVSRKEADYTREADLLSLLREARPDFLINAAGYTGFPNVAISEKHPDLCLKANTALPALLKSACGSMGLAWGHVSTGCLYSGPAPRASGFTEEDPPNFTFKQGECSFYSGTKALAEDLLASEPRVYVWRIRRPFNHQAHPKNTLCKILGYDVLVNQPNSYSHLDEIADAMLACWIRRLPFGLYHATNPGVLTAEEIVALARKHRVADKAYRFVAGMADLGAYNDGIPRAECVLDSSKIRGLGVSLTEIHEAVEQCFRGWQG
jgi:dTDP-4-dehydrorhamnose reductase